eukprot:IDg12328t1
MGNTLGKRISRPLKSRGRKDDRNSPRGPVQDLDSIPIMPDDDEPRNQRQRMSRRQSRDMKKRHTGRNNQNNKGGSGNVAGSASVPDHNVGGMPHAVGSKADHGPSRTSSKDHGSQGTIGHKPHSSSSTASTRYGRPERLGLHRIEFINVHRKEYTGRIELLQGSVEGLAKKDETDLLIVYLRERGVYKANRDSSMAALNRSGISLADLEKESKPQPSYRRHY